MRIALPNKGRLAGDARELFADAGLDVRARGERALTASLGDLFDAIFVRAEDIPEFVADGAAELGVTGWDLVRESRRELHVLLDLEFGRCRLAVAVRDESSIRELADIPAGARVATAFPTEAAAFFARAGVSAELVPLSGAAEVAPHLGIADLIVDLVSTGSTLKVNGLRELCTIYESTARLIARPELAATGGERWMMASELAAGLESVIRARGKRYLMANVPRARLQEVRNVLPGLAGPTVTDILNGGDHVAVHAVVAAECVYRTIGGLRALGASGILISRIERLVP